MAASTWGKTPIKDQSQQEFERRHAKDLERQRKAEPKRGR